MPANLWNESIENKDIDWLILPILENAITWQITHIQLIPDSIKPDSYLIMAEVTYICILQSYKIFF
jgi:hypothetical protein